MLIENTFFGEINKEEIAIERAIEFQNYIGKKNICGFSGGKDSIVLYDILKRSEIKFEAIYSQTSVDPPELIYFIRKNYPEVKIEPYNKDKEGNLITMWRLIPKKLIPPTRLARYCCEELKERTGEDGDTVYVGVRWAESNKRKLRKMVSFFKGKTMVRPLIDWTDEEIWEYIHKYKLPYPELYDKGFKRIGCIGCPLSSNQVKELELYPQIKKNYLRAFEKMLENRELAGKETTWETAEEVMEWWTGKSRRKEIEGQCSMFEHS